MSLIKLAIYGGIGYCVYQTLFAGMPAARTGQAKAQGSGGKGQGPQRGGNQGQPARAPQRPAASPAKQRLSGPGEGTSVVAKDPSGATTSHRVGRGVV